jgi:allantoin racemase
VAAARAWRARLDSGREVVFHTATTLRNLSEEHLIHAYGMAALCRKIRCTELAVLEVEREGSDARRLITEECRRALVEDGAEAIVLGCAGMADLTTHIAREIGAPVIDGVGAAVKFVEALVGLGLGTSKTGCLAYPLPKAYARFPLGEP